MGFGQQVVVLLAGFETTTAKSFWLDQRFYPTYVAAISIVVLSLHVAWASKTVQTTQERLDSYTANDTAISGTSGAPFWRRHIAKVGGTSIFIYKFTRLCAILMLISLVVCTAVNNGWTRFDTALTATLLYTSILASLNVFAPAKTGLICSFHLTVVTLAICGVYAFRNIWPLMTFTHRPMDEAEGSLLWVKIALLLFISFIEPVSEPYPYIPVDPEDPMPVVNPEQTASIISFLSYSFLDPMIWLAYRIPHLSRDQLPPLCDYDRAKNLIKRSYPYLDPFAGAKKRNLFFGMIIVFKRSLIFQTTIMIALELLRLTGPVGTNMLLSYLEKDGEGYTVKPWVWIFIIVAGPLFGNVSFQLYSYLSTGSLVRVESIITSLVFDHALRIRLKADTGEKKDQPRADNAGLLIAESNGDTQVDISPDNESTTSEDDNTTVQSKSTNNTMAATNSSTITVVTQPPPPKVTKERDTKKRDEKKRVEDAKSNGANLIGKINNLVTSDLDNITEGRDFLFIALSAPLQVVFSMTFLYVVLGWSSFVGFAVMIALIPVPTRIAKLLNGVQKQKMKATDSRVTNVTEMMSVLRMIKLFGWEHRVRDDVTIKREEELKLIWKSKMLGLVNKITNITIPIIHMIVTYATFTLIMKQPLSASIVFSSMSAFNMLRSRISRIFRLMPTMIRADVSLWRVAEFLRNTELLDEFTEKTTDDIIINRSADHRDDIGIAEADFTWSNELTDGTVTPSRQTFRLRIDHELVFKKGKFNLIIGPTGSGKTSVLMALLGEMHYIPLGLDSWANLPRKDGVAYAAQESWVQNETIRDNILFGAVYDEDRYKKVVYQCGLTRDLSLLKAGDATEVGEKGLTLSGGQKARVTLARAVYSSARILLLDDVLAALDVHTSRWIIGKCFQGDLVRDRTVLLVTHNVAMASPLADFVVCLGTDGQITSQGSVSDVLAKDTKLVEKLKHEEEALELDEHEGETQVEAVSNAEPAGKLVLAEEIEEGHISKAAFKLFLTALGGKWPMLFWSQYLTAATLSEMFDSLEMWWLGYWAGQYALHHYSEVSVPFYLGIYISIVLGVILFYVYGVFVYTYASMRASRSIHYKLVSSLLRSTFRWLDVTPTSRVIARCTQDIQSVDGEVARMLQWLTDITISMMVCLGAIMLFSPTFMFPALVIAVLGGWLGQVYIKAQLLVKREMSVAKAPVLGILGGAIAGLPSIRAYNAEDAFKREIAKRIDRYARASRSFYNLNRWIGVRIDVLSALFSGGLAFYLVYGSTTRDPSIIGFVLNMAALFSEMILSWVHLYNNLEISGNSLERINQYLDIEQEPEPKDGGVPPAHWPSSGDLRVEKLSARYSLEGPKILDHVSFHIRAGQRVGIVGRTGSGKSTLTLSLLRCIYTEGQVLYDGIATDTINLDALRSNITIIPQVPELLAGSLRQNLDMFDQYDDSTLNDALSAAGLSSLQRLSDENRLTLDSLIASGGSNLSVGQRQIIALARAIVRESKLLILDEATSAIDYETDTVIQSSLRNELKSDVTVITVAHRLQTIMDSDKIMVLDAGHLVEFDSPRVLLQNERSLLRALVDESTDKKILYAMAKAIQRSTTDSPE